MPKSKTRKGGKKKASQRSKQLKQQRVSAKLKQQKLYDQQMEKFQAMYTQQVKDELARREAEKTEKMEVVADVASKEFDMGFLGKSGDLFEKSK